MRRRKSRPSGPRNKDAGKRDSDQSAAPTGGWRLTGRCGPQGPVRGDHAGKNLPVSGKDFPRSCGKDCRRGPGPMKRGDCGRRRTAGRIERSVGDDGEPVPSPPGQHEISLAVWRFSVSRNVCGRAG